MEESECWPAVGCIEAGQSITDLAFSSMSLFHHFTNIEKFQTSQTVIQRPLASHPRVAIPKKINILLLQPNGIEDQSSQV